MRVMKITFITPPLNMSGGAKVICIYAEELQRLGHRVTIVSPPSVKLALKNRILSLLRGGGWPTEAKSAHLDGKNIDYRVINDHRRVVDGDVPDADCVIATWWETAEWVAELSPSKGRKIYFIQGHEVFEHLPARSRDTYRLPLHKIVIAKWLKDLMAKEYGDKNVDLVPNSVDRSQFYASDRAKQEFPTVGLIYSSVSVKGVDVAIKALKALQIKMPNMRIISFGNERPIPRLMLPRNTQFHFSPNQNMIRELYSQCDVWLAASRSEGFNLPALEAMACGTPVVSTRTGWPAEGIVDNVNGILVDVDDVEALAEALEKVLSLRNEEWQRMAGNARVTMASPSWGESAKMFERFLFEVIRKPAISDS